MPFNLIKTYPNLLEITHLSGHQRKTSLMGVFNRDIGDNELFVYNEKRIRPFKKQDGSADLETLFHHLTTQKDESPEGRKNNRRIYEKDRCERLHWVLNHIEERNSEVLSVFSFEDRVNGKDIIRTYILDKVEDYVIILEPYRNGQDYYLLTAYHLNKAYGKKQIMKKFKKKLPHIH